MRECDRIGGCGFGARTFVVRSTGWFLVSGHSDDDVVAAAIDKHTNKTNSTNRYAQPTVVSYGFGMYDV